MRCMALLALLPILLCLMTLLHLLLHHLGPMRHLLLLLYTVLLLVVQLLTAMPEARPRPLPVNRKMQVLVTIGSLFVSLRLLDAMLPPLQLLLLLVQTS